MRSLWFHLMPYKGLPADFKKTQSSIWIDVDPALLSPEKVHEYYNEFLDELEYAAECGFDAICVNEHHGNAYGLMPSPNLMAATLARRTADAAICVMGASLALYNPPTRVAEEFAMLDCISGGRLIAGFPVGTPMDTCYVYGNNPQHVAPTLPRGARADHQGVDGGQGLRLQRPVQPATLRQRGAPSRAASASADLGAGRRVGGDLAVVRGDGLRLLLRLLLRPRGGRGDHVRLLGGDGAPGQGSEPVPRRLPAVRRLGRDLRRGRQALPRAGGVLLHQLPAHRPQLRHAGRAM